MATRFPELNDKELLELLDDKVSDRSKNMIKVFGCSIIYATSRGRNGTFLRATAYML